MLSLPCLEVLDVEKTGGIVSQDFCNSFLYLDKFLENSEPDSLSNLVKTIENGIPFSPHQLMNSMSIF